jgi:hypothetical protein
VSIGSEPPPRAWLVDGLVPYGPTPARRLWLRLEPRGYVTALVAPGGLGKSLMLLDLGIACLTGGDWLGRPVRRLSSVLYVDAELEGEECRRRAWPLARGRGLSRPPRGLRYLQVECSLGDPEGIALVGRAVRKHRAGCVLVDSLTIGARGVALSDHNGWNRVLGGFESWGVPVVAIDHTGKHTEQGAVGSFMKHAKIRSQLTLERQGGYVQVTHAKSNFGLAAEPWSVAAQFIGPPGAPTCVAFVPVVPVAAPVAERAATVSALCQTPDCGRPVHANGLCDACRKRAERARARAA